MSKASVATTPKVSANSLTTVLKELRTRLEDRYVREVVVNRWGVVEYIGPSVMRSELQVAAWPPTGRCW